MGQLRKIRYLVGLTRKFRVWHRKVAIVAAVFLLLVALTGLLLAFKQETGLLPPGQDAGQEIIWLPVDSLMAAATGYVRQNDLLEHPVVDRIDLRPARGIAKITFVRSFLEIQVHGQTGSVLSSATRHADWIEKIHDGSIFDFLWDTNRPVFTWFYSGLTGLSLLVLVLTGVLLWVNPIWIRHWKKKYHGE